MPRSLQQKTLILESLTLLTVLWGVPRPQGLRSFTISGREFKCEPAAKSSNSTSLWSDNFQRRL